MEECAPKLRLLALACRNGGLIEEPESDYTMIYPVFESGTYLVPIALLPHQIDPLFLVGYILILLKLVPFA